MGAIAKDILRKSAGLEGREEISTEVKATEDKIVKKDPTRDSKTPAKDMESK